MLTPTPYIFIQTEVIPISTRDTDFIHLVRSTIAKFDRIPFEVGLCGPWSLQAVTDWALIFQREVVRGESKAG